MRPMHPGATRRPRRAWASRSRAAHEPLRKPVIGRADGARACRPHPAQSAGYPLLAATLCLLFFAVAAPVAAPVAAADDEAAARIELTKRGGDRILVTIDGQVFTEYRPGGLPDGGGHLPYLYPVYGPGGQAMTRNWPMSEAEEEEQDHPHHRSLWFAHGAVGPADGSKRYDFWTGRDGSAIVHQEILAVESGAVGVLRTSNSWIAPGGDAVLSEERTMTFRAGAFDSGQAWRAIDFDVRLQADDSDVILGDTKEGTMAVRVAPTLRRQGEHAQGSMRNSEGVEGAAVWGKRAAWVHYSGPVDGKPVGIAIFDHPENSRHPTWWHARAYGLFAANPFGVHDFEGAGKGAGDWTIPVGGELRLRYRLLFHDGEVSAEQLDGEPRRYGDE